MTNLLERLKKALSRTQPKEERSERYLIFGIESLKLFNEAMRKAIIKETKMKECDCKDSTWNEDAGCWVCDNCGERT